MTDGLTIDICSVDEQHGALAAAVNGLFVDHVPNRAEVVAAIDQLMAAVRDHFAHEERIMRNIGLPDYERHAQIHRRLLSELDAFRSDVERNVNDKTPDELRTYLTFWLFRHISRDDMLIRAHMHR